MLSSKSRRWIIIVGLLVLIILLSPLPVQAGGWAAISLDNWPGGVTAGQALQIGFVVRQHGRNPLPGLTPSLRATHVESGKTLEVNAREDGQPGHYVAELTFDLPGAWDWSIQAFTMLQPLPPLQVVSPSQAIQTSTRLPVWLSIIAGLLGLMAIGFAARLSLRRQLRQAAVLTLTGILLAAVGLISFSVNQTIASAQTGRDDSKTPVTATLPPTSENGQILFIAKGCATCHFHPAIPEALSPKVGENLFSGGIGPNLPTERNDPAYLRVWLANPSSIKPDTQMPNLELDSQEIEALISFLTAPTSPIH